jgi:hypothetical protein
MSVIINGVYRYQTVAVEGKSRMYVTALDRQREVLKKLISKNRLTIENFIFSEKGCWCTVCGKVFNSFDQKDVETLILKAQEEAGFKW